MECAGPKFIKLNFLHGIKETAAVARVRSAGAAWENFQAAEDVHEGNIKELMRSFAMRVKPLAAYVTAEGGKE